jgi:bifunctional non-homologous end joining protein LigD
MTNVEIAKTESLNVRSPSSLSEDLPLSVSCRHVKRPFPQIIEPMIASLIKDPFHSPDRIFETKLDGYRAIVVIDETGKTRIWSRNRLPLEQKFPTVRDAAEELKLRSTILDGEIVALDEEGIPRLQLLQKWQKRPTAPVVYVLFDLLWDNGHDLTGNSVVQRRERLQEIITPVDGIQVGATSRSAE